MSPKFLGRDHPARRLHKYGSITSPPRWGLIFLDPKFLEEKTHILRTYPRPYTLHHPIFWRVNMLFPVLNKKNNFNFSKQKEKLQLQRDCPGLQKNKTTQHKNLQPF